MTARAAFLMDGTTGEVLYQREPDLPLPPASTTKIVAAIVALESGSLKGIVPVSRTATRVPSSKIGLRPGQAMSIRDLLYGLLLSSANDASLVLAEGIAGSVAHFAEMMTRKAREIGAKNSHFVNPHGLTAPGHYSTARDMALLFNYAIKHPEFRKIIQTKTSSVRLISTGKAKRPMARQITLRSHNRLLWGFDGAIGGKTGYTIAAQKTFVGGASRNGTTLIVSVLGSRNLWGDTKKLLEYGFDTHQGVTVASTAPSPSLSNGHSLSVREKPSSPLFSWEEEQRVQSSNGYFLQVASFRERERAESLQKKIIEDGYRAYVEAAPLDNGETAYRIRVGPYPQLAYAQEVAREIEKENGFRAIIVSFPLPETVEKFR
ncbi:MAG: SPOR domain-containing protein [Candidatus Binatia bacterium]